MPPVFNISLEAILRGCDKSLDWLKGNSIENPWEFSPWNVVPQSNKRLNLFFSPVTIHFLMLIMTQTQVTQAAQAIEKLGKLWLWSTTAFGKYTILSQSLTKNGGILWVFCVLSSNLLRLSCLRVQNCGKDPIGSVSSRPRWVWRSCQLDEIITLPGFLCHSPYQTTLTFNWGQFTPRNREWLEMGARFST